MLKYFAHFPHEGEHLVEQNYVFEVLAREGHRVDEVLVLTTKIAGTNPKSANAVDSSDALIVHPPSTRCRNPGPRPNLATPKQQRDRAERLHAVEDILKPGGGTTVRQSFLVEGGRPGAQAV